MRFFSRHLKLEPTLQVAQAECGLCCVRTLLAAHGLNMSLTELRQVKEPGRDGLGIQQLKRLLIFFGMDANRTPRSLKVLTCPSLPSGRVVILSASNPLSETLLFSWIHPLVD